MPLAEIPEEVRGEPEPRVGPAVRVVAFPQKSIILPPVLYHTTTTLYALHYVQAFPRPVPFISFPINCIRPNARHPYFAGRSGAS